MTPQDEKIVRELAIRLAEEAETKRVFKEAIDEWMERKYAEFGKWSLNRILVMLVAAFVVFVMWTQGYKK